MTSEFFLWCAGTSRQLLDQCLEDDRIRQEQLGAHVFFTAVLAFFSSYFALAYAFDQTWSILIFSSLWCISIFLLDRTLIVSPVLTYRSTSSRSKNISNDRLATAWETLSIRLVLAALLGLFIATPFELKIFAPEIEEQILSEHKEINIARVAASLETVEARKLATINDYQNKSNLLASASLVEKQIDNEIKELKKRISEKEQSRVIEFDKGNGGAKPGAGKRFNKLSGELDKFNVQLENKEADLRKLSATRQSKSEDILKQSNEALKPIDEELSHLESQKKSLTAGGVPLSDQQREAKLQDFLKLSQAKAVEMQTRPDVEPTALKSELAQLDSKIKAIYDGGDGKNDINSADSKKFSLLTRIEALAKLQTDKERVRVACWIVFSVFMLFEIIPILAKFFFKGSAYDFLILREKRLAEAGVSAAVAEAVEREEESKWRSDAARTQTEVLRQRNDALLSNTFPSDAMAAMKKEWDDIIRSWGESEKRKHNRSGDIDYLEEAFETLFKDDTPRRKESVVADGTNPSPSKVSPAKYSPVKQRSWHRIYNSFLKEGIFRDTALKVIIDNALNTIISIVAIGVLLLAGVITTDFLTLNMPQMLPRLVSLGFLFFVSLFIFVRKCKQEAYQ